MLLNLEENFYLHQNLRFLILIIYYEILKDYEQKEGKGFTKFSYYDALVDKNGTNYVIKNLIDMFKDAEISRQQKNLELNVESIIDYYKSGTVG